MNKSELQNIKNDYLRFKICVEMMFSFSFPLLLYIYLFIPNAADKRKEDYTSFA